MPVYHPYFSDLVLLMHLDGNLVDSSPLGQGYGNSGGVFVGGGGAFGSGLDIGGGVNVATSSAARLDYDLNAGDFTIEAWVKPAFGLATAVCPAVSLSKPGAVGMSLSVYGDGTAVRARFDYEVGAGIQSIASNTSGVALTNGAVYHLAGTRYGDTYRLFVNGVLVSFTNDASRGVVTARKAMIGNFDGVSQGFQGVVYDASVCRRCLWTSAFTPPAEPYANFWPASCQAWPAGMA